MTQIESIESATSHSREYGERYITSSQIAAYVKVSRVAVHYARLAGRLPNAILSGRDYVWERASIQPHIDAWRDRVAHRHGVAQ